MFHLSQTIRFDLGDALSFPQDECCNCGTRNNLSVIPVDVSRRVSYVVITNTYVVKCRLPFCPECVKTAERKWGMSFVDRLFEFVGCFVALIFLGALVSEQMAAIFALIGAVGIVLVRMSLARPKGNQTSYFVPVRLFKLKRKMLRNEIKSMGLLFTSDSYKRKFERMNAQIIESGFVSVKSKKQQA